MDHRARPPAGRIGRTHRLPASVMHLIGWPSLALGVLATCWPTATAGLIGLEPRSGARVIRIAGWRELAVLAAFLGRPAPRSLWWFVGQDLCDISAGSVALACRATVISSRSRLETALAGYGVLLIADLATALRHGRSLAH